MDTLSIIGLALALGAIIVAVGEEEVLDSGHIQILSEDVVLGVRRKIDL